MILIGQFDSPFTRRVAITMRLYGLPFEHRPWSVFGDSERLAAINPLVRVPTLILDDGLALTDSGAILDHLDQQVEPARRLVPPDGRLRTEVLRICALAGGLGDKAVALFYELRLHEAPSAFYVARCEAQVRSTLALLARERAARTTPFWFGDTIGQADITVAAILRHLREAHPQLGELADQPLLAHLCQTLEATEIFQEISQPFIAPSA